MADYLYNGRSALSLRDRIAGIFGRKEGAPIAFITGMTEVSWMTPNARNYVEQGYNINSAIFACTKALANGIAEAPLKCYTDETKKKDDPKHPVKLLFNRPNPYMGEDEYWRHIVTYAATTGNGYGKLTPSKLSARVPAPEMYPYSDVVMWAVPGEQEWVQKFAFSKDNGAHVEDIDPKLVAHWKWAVDPLSPYKGMGALAPVSREVNTDNELTRFLMAFLQNDAVMSGILTTGTDIPITPTDRQKMKQDFERGFGTNNKGRVAVLPAGVGYQRIALNMEELALDALRGVPEARIAAAYGVPAIVAGLNIGLARSTYSNFEEARKAFTETTLVPLWKSLAAEVQSSIVPLFGNDVVVDFDLSGVKALQEGNDKKAVWVTTAYDKGILTLNEARAELGKDALPDGDTVKKPAPPPTFGGQPNDLNAQDAPNNTPPAEATNQAPTGSDMQGSNGKAHEADREIKEITRAQEVIVKRIQATMDKAIGDGYDSIAAHLER